MNKWVEKSINLANSSGYLDKLADIYPVNLTLARTINPAEQEKIKDLFNRKRAKELINELLKLDRFPIDDPYVGFLRKDKGAINKNPKTVKRISNRLYRMGLENLIMGASKEKSPSRQVGQMFRKWIHKIGYPVLSKSEFLSIDGVAFLDGGDAALVNFAREELGYGGQKGLDAVLKVGDKFILAETKLITTNGGTQDKSFREGVSFIKAKDKKRDIIKIAIFDGVVWIVSEKAKLGKKKLSLYETVIKLKNNEIVLSALLLKDFVESLR